MKQSKKKVYKVFIKNNNTYNCIKCNSKELLKINPKLIINSNNTEIYRLNNIQSLYLFPLSVIDYINNLNLKEVINVNIIEIDSNLNYEEIFNDKKFKYLKSVEILVKDDYNKKQMLKICDIIEYFYKKNILISLNIKDLANISDLLNEKFRYISYFKIFLPNSLENKTYIKFLRKLLTIKQLKSSCSLIHVKTYLNINKVILYEKMISDFSRLNVDIFQVSKELIPINHTNIEVDNKIQDLIRNLETKYKDYNQTKFISVKDLSTLYYPRFELDERNSKKCYSCYMKPYLFKDKILPCKVNKIFENIESWSSKYNDYDKYDNITNKCGVTCDDCASIFENDLLYNIEKIYKNNKFIDISLIKE